MRKHLQTQRVAFFTLCFILVFFASLPAQSFVGSAACSGCHSTHATEWNATLHANLYREAIPANIISPFSGDVTITDASRGLEVTLVLDDNGGAGPFTVDLYKDQAKTMHLIGPLELVRAHGGKAIAKNNNDGSVSRGGVAGESEYIGKQRYHVAINGAEYILPNQWNPVADLDGNNSGWVEYHLRDWVDAQGDLIIEENAATHSEARRCAGCHRTGIESVTHDGSKYVLNGAAQQENIGCEACHGPGGDHVGAPSKANIINPATDLTQTEEVDLCGSCHSRGTSVEQVNNESLGYPYANGRTFRPGDVWADFYTEGGGYWGDGETAKQHHQQYEEFITSKHYSLGQRCSSCHDMHGSIGQPLGGTADGTFEHQLIKSARGLAAGTQCVDCHSSKADTAHTMHPVDNPLAPDCTNCHMPAMAKSGVNYDIHSHAFNHPSPQNTLDLAMPNSCAILCHRGAGPENNGGYVDTDINTWDSSTDVAIANWLLGNDPILTPPITFTFDSDAQGWVFSGQIPPFEAPANSSDTGALGISPAGGFPVFAFWDSPEILIDANKTYRVRYTVGSTVTNPDDALAFRLRTSQGANQQGVLRVVQSVGGAAPTDTTSKVYDLIVQPQLDSGTDVLKLSVDADGFDPFNDLSSWVYAEEVTIEEVTVTDE